MKNPQIRTVLDVSIVERWAAEAFLVVATPKALKAAMEQIMPILYQMRMGLSAHC
jgi:hypothetical protein